MQQISNEVNQSYSYSLSGAWPSLFSFFFKIVFEFYVYLLSNVHKPSKSSEFVGRIFAPDSVCEMVFIKSPLKGWLLTLIIHTKGYSKKKQYT